MLIQFRFKNFKSFRDDTVLDFSATEDTENEYRIAKVGDERCILRLYCHIFTVKLPRYNGKTAT